MSQLVRVRVIEDNDALRQATLTILQQAGFDVMGFSCAEDLDDTPAAHQSDAYVIDLNLPGEDGFTLAMRLRRAQPNAIIIITTARTHLNDRIKGYEAGANIYMPKPVDPQELVAALISLVTQRDNKSKHATGLRLASAQRMLAGPAGDIRLTDSETRLLVTIASAKDQTLERWQIVSQLNPNAEDISADSLQNRLSQLRKKIQAAGIHGESIRAVRGVGYQLCVPLVLLP